MSALKQKLLDQYPTPAWTAEALVRLHFSDLSSSDVVVDPTCGPGRFLQAIPSGVPAYGVELDNDLAEYAEKLTGRKVIKGDIREVCLKDLNPTAFIGNPPFKMKLVDHILERAHELLPEEGRVGLILPAYAMQTASRVVRYSEKWSLEQEMIPRNIYPGLSKPLIFTIFRKDQRKLMLGFSLYHEAAAVLDLPKSIQEQLVEGPITWKELVLEGIKAQGGKALLSELYEYISSRRPTKNPHWKEQIRKICQTHAQRIAPSQYALCF